MHIKHLVILLLLSLGSLYTFAQERGFGAHAEIKPKIKPVENQQMLAQLFEAAEKATTPLQKARQYFLISRSYASLLKIDSSLAFADKIKELAIA